MAKQPLIVVEFTKQLDDMIDDEVDALAGEVAEAMAANFAERHLDVNRP